MEYAFALHLLKSTLKCPVLIKLSALEIRHQQTEQVHSDDFYLSLIIKGARLGLNTSE